MTITQFMLIFATVLALSFGQVLFKLSASSTGFNFFGRSLDMVSPTLFCAIIVYAFATIMWLFVLKITPLRIAYPLAGLAFIFVPMLSFLLVGEQLHWNTFIGAIIICIGIWISIIQ